MKISDIGCFYHMDQKEFFKILNKYRAGKATEAERQMIDAWYENMGQKSKEATNNLNEDELEEYYWAAISEKMKQPLSSNNDRNDKTKIRSLNYSIGIAASLLILLISSLYFFLGESTSLNDVFAKKEMHNMPWEAKTSTKEAGKQIVLSDGSKITLDPNSSILISKDFNTSFRDVKLVGKAFFEVAHNPNKPFRVYTNGVITKVLGTSFTIKALENDKDVVVAVKSGRVVVYKNETDTREIPKTILTPNHQAIYNKEKKSITKGIVEEPLPLIEIAEVRRLRFEAAPVKEVFLAMEKVYGVDIVFDEERYSSCTLTTSLANGGLYERLNIVTNAIGATYSIDENKVVISGSGCSP